MNFAVNLNLFISSWLDKTHHIKKNLFKLRDNFQNGQGTRYKKFVLHTLKRDNSLTKLGTLWPKLLYIKSTLGRYLGTLK